ncbi:type I polyketide synthase [Sorangium sp. So ce1097]|uniref:type I polyketide synthase n=1 Tax=Sorangium sp. So ce1097 TaxID=3133330 RepID=UPI003F62E431
MSDAARSQQASLLRSAALELKNLQSKLDAVARSRSEPLAVIGIGCRFPGGASEPEAYWRLLRDGVDAIREVPPDRWDVDAYYHPDPRAPGKMNTRWGGFLERVDGFDPYFFGISPRECVAMDPQQRLFLEVAWEALEDAGQAVDRLRGSQTGVYVGVFGSDYATLLQADPERIDVYGSSGAGCAIPGRLSFLLDLRGPCVAVDTACSSSLTAIHLACQSLRSGESDLAVVGGINLILSPVSTIALTKIQALAPDGRCKTFDARADGMARSEGCGVVVLKRLSRALADGDPIRALIRGSAVNQDGASTSFSSPNVLAQQAVIQKALESAGVDPVDVDFVEAHGTGTALGDPIEIEALKATYGRPRPEGRPCVIGAVKTNMGHLEGASGIAGFIKVVCSLEREAIPANLHFTKLNPHISLGGTPFLLPTALRSWPRGERRRFGAVSAFGLNGANAHVVLEEAPEAAAAGERAPRAAHVEGERAYLLPLSAKSPEALRAFAQAYSQRLARLDAEPTVSLHDLCYTASVRRAHHDQRLSVLGSTPAALRDRLDAFLRGERAQGVTSGAAATEKRRGLVFVFSPHGSQWLGMGRKLFEEEPVVRETIERCDALMRQHTGWSLIERLCRDDDAGWLEQIDVLQPCLFALQVALAALLRSAGVEPSAVVGHSMGEVAAAHVAGALSLEDAVRIACRRSRLLRKTSGQGAMAVVELSLEAARAALRGYESRVFIAVSNSPRSTVLSGEPSALEELLDRLESQGVFCGWGVADVASHSPQMKVLCAALLEELAEIAPRDAAVPFYSTVTGAPLSGRALGPDYWVQNLTQTVLFSTTVTRLLDDDLDVFLELSPHPVLAPAIEDGLRHVDRTGSVLATLRREDTAPNVLLDVIGALYTLGYPIDWKRLYPSGGRCVQLPSYPWQRERFWIEAPSEASDRAPARRSRRPGGGAGHPFLGERWEAPAPEGTSYWKIAIDTADLPYLTDHRVQGSVVLPAVSYLEMALAGARALFGGAPVALERVRFEKMLVVPEQGAVSLQLVIAADTEGAAEFRIFSRSPDGTGQGASWTLHAHGLLRRAPEATPALAAPDAIRARCASSIGGTEFYRGAAERGVQFGPSFQGIAQLSWNEDEAVASVLVPEAVAADRASYHAHPALLDACFHALGAAGMLQRAGAGGDAIYLPTGIERFRLHGAPGARLFSHAVLRRAAGEGEGERGRDFFEGDLAILDDEGRLVIEASGVRFQHFDGSRDAGIDDWFYAVTWRSKPLSPPAVAAKPAPSPGSTLIFTDSTDVGKALRAGLEARGERCVLAAHGDAYRAVDTGLYELDPTRPEDFRQLLKDAFGGGAPPCREVIFLWALDTEGPESLTLASLQAAEDLVGVGLMHLIQALAQAGFRDPPRLFLVTRGAQAAGAQPHPIAIAQAPLWALGWTITHEHPEIGCFRVDLDPAVTSSESALSLLEHMKREDLEDQSALRGGARYVARLDRWSPPPGYAAMVLRADATYLITGGLSGLGLAVAEWMATKGARHLVLLGRRGATPEAQPALERMAKAGVEVVVERTDVSQEAQLSSVLQKIERSMPPLRGVVHSAVTLDDGILLRQNRERFRSAVAAKLEGAFHLHRLTAGYSLDFFVLFSSGSTLGGQPGDCSYGASNAFVDALAHHRRAMGLPGLSINWGPWSEVGLGAAQANRGERLGFRGVASITPEQGVTRFGRLLGAPAAQVGVMRFDLRQWRQFYPKIAGSPLFAELDRRRHASAEASKKAVELLAALRAAEPPARRQQIESLVRAQITEVLRLDPSRINASTPLKALGFDSLMAVELRNRLEVLLGTTLPVTLIWGYPTIAALVPHLASKIGVPLEPSGRAAPEEDKKDDSALSSLLGNIEQLSMDDALSLLVGKGR